MADTDTRAAPAEQPRDESRSEARRDLNKTVAQRQKLLLAGIGGVALIAGSMFIFGGDDAEDGEGAGSTTIETGALVNRNLSQREFVATYGNRLDAQGKAWGQAVLRLRVPVSRSRAAAAGLSLTTATADQWGGPPI
mgnify:CR=1 FL=1